jgi:hypothetical protein
MRVVFLLFFGVFAAFAHIAAAAERPPKIMFILADDLGWAELGC